MRAKIGHARSWNASMDILSGHKAALKSSVPTPHHSCYAYMFCLVPSVTLLEGDAQTPIENLTEGNSVFDHKHNTRKVSLNHHFDLNNTLTPHNNQTTRNQDARQANRTAGTTATVFVFRTNSPITNKRSVLAGRLDPYASKRRTNQLYHTCTAISG